MSPEIKAPRRKVVPRREEETYSKVALKLMERGRVEGRLEGVKETTRANVLRLLERRFGSLPDSARERVASAKLTELDVWFDRGLDAQSLAEVFDGQGR